MADSFGRLRQEDIEKVTAWLGEKFKPALLCPVCRQNQWILGEYLTILPTAPKAQAILGGPSYPHIVLTCGNCANTLLLSAVKIGVAKGGSNE